MEIIDKKIILENNELVTMFAINETLMSLIENRFSAVIVCRGNVVSVKGISDEVTAIEAVFKELSYIIKRNKSLSEKDVVTVIDLVNITKQESKPVQVSTKNSIIYNGYKDQVRVKNDKQLEYYQEVLNNDLVFAIGPAGTGKTYLAVAMALAALKNNEVSRIILSRPAVEAGESLGFLPGDLNEKIDPYLRPLTDALQAMLSIEKYKSLREKGIIEINPLAYMRGRTLNNAFIILDEAQNATRTQMKMFLTRMGANSKAIITGDITQIDLPNKKDSGLINAEEILKGVEDIGFVYFANNHVIRHKLVADIIKAYESHGANEANNKLEKQSKFKQEKTSN